MSRYAALRNAFFVAMIGLSAVSMVEFSSTTDQASVTIPTGTVLRIRLNRTVVANASRTDSEITGQLAGAVIVAGRTVLPEGSEVSGVVVESQAAGKEKARGPARIALQFTTLAPRNSSGRYRIETRSSESDGPELDAGAVLNVRLTRPLIVRAA